MSRKFYEIYGEEKEKCRELKPVILRLVVGSANNVVVQAVDKDGKYLSNLVGFDRDTGKVYRPPSIRDDLGLPLDSQDRILFEKD